PLACPAACDADLGDRDRRRTVAFSRARAVQGATQCAAADGYCGFAPRRGRDVAWTPDLPIHPRRTPIDRAIGSAMNEQSHEYAVGWPYRRLFDIRYHPTAGATLAIVMGASLAMEIAGSASFTCAQYQNMAQPRGIAELSNIGGFHYEYTPE